MTPELNRIASVVVLGSIMSILDTTIVAVALATLGRDFHVPVSTIQWVTTGYLLALAVVIPITGWAVDRFGAKTDVDDVTDSLHRRIEPLRHGLVGELPHLLPRPPRPGRRDDPARSASRFWPAPPGRNVSGGS